VNDKLQGGGEKHIWRVKDNDKELLPTAQYGQFYAGESYIVFYTYIEKNTDKILIYFWQGRTSKQVEKVTIISPIFVFIFILP